MSTDLGIVEGFFGIPWSDQERTDAFAFLKGAGFSFYIYAPKADPFFRKKWREPIPEERIGKLRELAKACKKAGLKFGIGLSPYELYLCFDESAKEALTSRLRLIDELQADFLGIFFDDMRGDRPRLAEEQIEILHWVRDHSSVSEILFCPTYYSDDPILDRVFGQRPENYLKTLGQSLDPSIQIFWTGPKVCSKEYPTEHLRKVRSDLKRAPFLWDNYPVNDGQRMCQHLHLRAYPAHSTGMDRQVKAIAANPMNQAVLSRIPLLTLRESLNPETYDAERSFQKACWEVGGEKLAPLLIRDVALFQDDGLKKISPALRSELRVEYASVGDPAALPAAMEVVRWLDGEFEVSAELVKTQ